MDASEQINRFKEFFEENYKADMLNQIRLGKNFLSVDFSDLSVFDPGLAENFLSEPDEALKAAELAAESTTEQQRFRMRLFNLPESQKIMIRNIRSSHIGGLYVINGIVRQKSDVRPQVVTSKFECPSCGNIITVLQLETSFKEPRRCGCGRKGKFRLLSQELVDAQGMVLEEVPEELEGGEQPKRINVFLKEDLVSPITEKRTNPGSKIQIIGQIKEIPIISKGTKLTRFDLLIEANNVVPVEEDFYAVGINEEEEKEILALANDPKIYDKLVNSIAPSVYGYERIKEALILELLGGVQKRRKDGVTTRGDIHVLLVGDPGCIAGDSQVALAYKGMEKIQNLGNKHLQPIKEVVTKIRKYAKEEGYDFATVFHNYKNQPVLKVRTETGKEVICTYNQPFLTEDGWKRADEILWGTKIRVMPKIPNNVKKYASTGFTRLEEKSGRLKQVILPEKFTPELASLCGYILGDGNIHGKGYRVTCYVNEEETDLIEKISSLWLDAFSIAPKIITRDMGNKIKTIDDGSGLLRQIVSRQKMSFLEVNSRQIAQSLWFLSNKRVPQQIFRSPNGVVARFISWLFEADGCAFGNGRGRTSVQLKSRNKELLKDVQLLLLYFGIQSRVIADNLCIRRCRDILLFAEFIGFNSEKKKRRLQEVLEDMKKRRDANKRKTPQRYERVVEIIPTGCVDVYDLEVPASNMFIANGIVCHNSGKSQLLKRISMIAPKGRYVSGKGVSGAGITAAVVRDEFLGGWSLEAGALVLANNGVCCVDEMDKMNPDDRAAMHEALEQQSYHYDTEIMFADGTTEKIGEFVDRLIERDKAELKEGKNCEILLLKDDVELLTTDFSSIYPTQINRISRHIAPNHFYKISYSNGRSIIVTPEHPVFISEGSKMSKTIPAERIKKGMLAPAPTKLMIKKKSIGSFKKVANSCMKLVKIVNVEKIANSNQKWTYDVTVEPNHTFISENLVLHNTISISKANIQATLLARTTVLAAANPKLGRFDPHDIIATQIDMPPTLINRFDLIFPIKDIPDKDRDEKMARHILGLHQTPDGLEAEIPTLILKKYFAYARQKVSPKLTDTALNEIRIFYTEMRNRGVGEERAIMAVPISARQLEALVRLAEASARSRLSKRVTKMDARRAIGLLTYCLLQVGLDRETGKIDIDRIATGISASQRDKIYNIKAVLTELEANIGKIIPINDVLRIARERGIAEEEVEEIIQKLKRSGDIYEPKAGYLSLIS